MIILLSCRKKSKHTYIPVSCFTATAKQKVISDIKVYFRQKLNIELKLYTTNATRSNLRYEVLNVDDDNEKYSKLRDLIEQKDCPTIVYASRTKKTVELAVHYDISDSLENYVQEAISLIQQSKHFDEMQRDTATRIIKKLISCRSRAPSDFHLNKKY